MGSRKKYSNAALKEAKAEKAIARLRNTPTSPRKMRLIADLIRGEDVLKALAILKYTKNHSSIRLEKLLFTAIENWKNKNQDTDIEEVNLFVKEIYVDSARMLKRLQTAPQGRAHRIRKRSNHVTIILDTKD